MRGTSPCNSAKWKQSMPTSRRDRRSRTTDVIYEQSKRMWKHVSFVRESEVAMQWDSLMSSLANVAAKLMKKSRSHIYIVDIYRTHVISLPKLLKVRKRYETTWYDFSQFSEAVIKTKYLKSYIEIYDDTCEMLILLCWLELHMFGIKTTYDKDRM